MGRAQAPSCATAASPLLATAAPPTNTATATTTAAVACMARRRLMALLIMLGFFTCYTMRVNLSVAAEPMQVRGGAADRPAVPRAPQHRAAPHPSALI